MGGTEGGRQGGRVLRGEVVALVGGLSEWRDSCSRSLGRSQSQIVNCGTAQTRRLSGKRSSSLPCIIGPGRSFLSWSWSCSSFVPASCVGVVVA